MYLKQSTPLLLLDFGIWADGVSGRTDKRGSGQRACPATRSSARSCFTIQRQFACCGSTGAFIQRALSPTCLLFFTSMISCHTEHFVWVTGVVLCFTRGASAGAFFIAPYIITIAPVAIETRLETTRSFYDYFGLPK